MQNDKLTILSELETALKALQHVESLATGIHPAWAKELVNAISGVGSMIDQCTYSDLNQPPQ